MEAATSTVDISSLSPWLAAPPRSQTPLRGELEADVAVVGAGFSGLSSALSLRREGLRVAVLDSQIAGYGASGRNAGHLTPTIGKDLPSLSRMYGRARVRGLLELAEVAISHVEGAIEKHAIDCDYEPVGNLIAAVHPKQHDVIDRTAQVATEFGIPGELLDRSALVARGIPATFTRGYLEPHGGILDPGKYLRGLRRAALEAGAQLFENSPVTGISDGPPAVVETAGGRVRCQHVVIATNAYTPQLSRLDSVAVRIQVQLFRTAPLRPEQLERIDWRGREGIYTAHELLESFRLTSDQRILGGSKFIRAGFGKGILADTDPRVCRRLETVFRQRFPELADVPVEQHWGGPIYMSLDFLPRVGRSGARGNILHAIAYAGHGIAQASYAGEMVTDLLLERDGPGSALQSRWRIPVPPEPLRWLAFQGLTRYFEAVDRRVDRALTARGDR